MRAKKDGEFRSSVYMQRPPYADFDAPAKFQAIQSIIAKRLKEHPNAMCSYSGGSDSDIMLHMIETARRIFSLPPVKYYFFETGLEMEATRRHVRETAELYGVEIQIVRPKKNIVQATREYGQPFVSKIMSAGLEAVQKKNIPLSVADEYDQAEDKAAKRKELKSRYPGCEQAINFLCCCNSAGERDRISSWSSTAPSTCLILSRKIRSRSASATTAATSAKSSPHTPLKSSLIW